LETTIGRDCDADVTIDNVGVSRLHAKVTFDGHNFVVSDDGSSNGLCVNGKPTEFAVLKDGDLIGINKFLVRFSATGGMPPEALRARHPSGSGRPRDAQKTINAVAALREAALQQIRQQRLLVDAPGSAPPTRVVAEWNPHRTGTGALWLAAFLVLVLAASTWL
jgi:pSer/pThr/pTyr-binding forkhead associated (FHA) protein